MLKIRGLTKEFRYREQLIQALDGVDLDVAAGEFFVLLGPSGCGKTTMLRSIAGLERPDHGTIAIDGETVFAPGRGGFVPPERRPIGMVFQSYAIWPHMNVHENVAFPLREGVRRLPPAEVAQRVGQVLDLLGLAEMADRPVTTLSGGQQQRVALARALALRPKVLLMDEPLSNLDFKLQVRLRAQLKALMRRLGLTTIYVTHNQAEAMETGDRIAVMDRGRLVQLGTPREIYQRPVDEFVARFIGEMSLVPARVVEVADGHAMLECPMGRVRAALPAGSRPAHGAGCLLGVRPEDLRLDATPAEGENRFAGRIIDGQFVGEAMLYTVSIGDVRFRVKAHHAVAFAEGQAVALHLPPEHCAAVAPVRRDANEPDETLSAA